MTTADLPQGSVGLADPSAAPLLKVDDLHVSFPTDGGLVRAVRGVSFELREGEVLGIVGESGSGKSVTMMAAMGLLPRTARIEGSVTLRGRELLGMEAHELNRVRGDDMVMIFQDPMTSLNPVHKVGSQIAEAVRAHYEVDKDTGWKRAVEMLRLVGIPQPEQRAHSYPHEFSGGMRQRAMIAMAMANDPQLIIADEPTTALDVTVQAQVLDVLRTAKEETGAAVILITHDLGVVANMADRVLVMYAGRPVEIASVDEVYDNPRMPYTVGLLGSLPRVDADGSERLHPIKGTPPSMVSLPSGCPFRPRCPLAVEVCVEQEPVLEATSTAEDHWVACHRWREVAREPDPVEIFDTGSGAAL
ncbi:MAG: ABC transporter ATP-binding protein [Actinobacteria bacterium]|nr:ABC transporter ATP-binding protein [Actinomycetota bacterium]